MRRLPTTRQLEAFLAIEATRNLTAASARLHISQPALSRTLQQTEQALETPLFERSTRSVELTAAGAALLPIAKRLLGEFRESFGLFGDYLDGHKGHVTVAGLPSAVVALLPRAIRRLADLSPGVDVKVQGLVEQQVLAALRTGSIDFALAAQPAMPGASLFSPLLADDYVLLCRHDHALGRRRAVPWSALAAQPFLAMAASSSVRATTDRVFLELGITPGVSYESDHIGLMGPMVAAGLGVTVLPRLSLALTDCTGLAVVRLTGPVTRRAIGLLRRSDLPLSPPAQRLADAIREECRRAPTGRAG